jgi:hypothetical protein
VCSSPLSRKRCWETYGPPPLLLAANNTFRLARLPWIQWIARLPDQLRHNLADSTAALVRQIADVAIRTIYFIVQASPSPEASLIPEDEPLLSTGETLPTTDAILSTTDGVLPTTDGTLSTTDETLPSTDGKHTDTSPTNSEVVEYLKEIVKNHSPSSFRVQSSISSTGPCKKGTESVPGALLLGRPSTSQVPNGSHADSALGASCSPRGNTRLSLIVPSRTPSPDNSPCTLPELPHEWEEFFQKRDVACIARIRPATDPSVPPQSMLSSEKPGHMFMPPYADRQKAPEYQFDHVMLPAASNGKLRGLIAALVTRAKQGYPACIILDGQSGSGKTHTMFTGPQCITEQLASLIFSVPHMYATCSAVEMFQGRSKPIQFTEDGSVTEKRISWNVKEFSECMKDFHDRRHKGKTRMNSISSRSHLIIRVRLAELRSNNARTVYGDINLIDLAGSEQEQAFKSDEERRVSKSIVKSRDALKTVFRNRYRTTLIFPSSEVRWHKTPRVIPSVNANLCIAGQTKSRTSSSRCVDGNHRPRPSGD